MQKRLTEDEIGANSAQFLSLQMVFTLLKDESAYRVLDQGRKIIMTILVPIAATVFEQSFEIELEFVETVEEKLEDRFFTKREIEAIITKTERKLKEEFEKQIQMLRTEHRESLKEEIRRVEGKVSASSNIELQKVMN